MPYPADNAPCTATSLETYFQAFRQHIIGIHQTVTTPYGTLPIIYTDWTASGRLYGPIEDKLRNEFGPYVANTHTETTVTGMAMTHAYHEARNIIKQHVHAADTDVLITDGTGMTGVVNKFQRMLGLRIPEHLKTQVQLPTDQRPVVFISHMEHHSNQTSWLETVADVVIIPANSEGLLCLDQFDAILPNYAHRPLKIASITSCSNVTGLETPYYEVAKRLHRIGGYCFVDFACSGPYVDIDMHPADPEAALDAIFFSPHKFLGGPGTCGVLVFNQALYNNQVPDCPGGGTVSWTNPWGEHRYIDDIEAREDGGTPGFLQVMKAAMAIRLKERMGTQAIRAREHELIGYVFDRLDRIPNLVVLAGQHRDRLGVFSFYIKGLHYNLGVRMLNDRFGIQTRGGCSCAGTYGHFLLHVDRETSQSLTCQINQGDLTNKPGWIRMSIHPTTTDAELVQVCDGIEQLALHFEEWSADYQYHPAMNAYFHHAEQQQSYAPVLHFDC